MKAETFQLLHKKLDFDDIFPYSFYYGYRYKIGCRKHCHCYMIEKNWKEAQRTARAISLLPVHKDCLVDIHDGQSGFKIGFVNGIMGIIANFNYWYR